jgi:hypothetical protein
VVVEEALGARLVDRDHRAGEPPLRLQRAQPEQAGRRLLRPPDEAGEQLGPRCVQDGEQVGAVVERHLRRAVDDGDDALGVGVGVLAALPVRRAAVGRERGDDLVLRREGIGRREGDLGPAGGERADEAAGLRRHMEAGADPQPGERLLLREPLADRPQDGHLPVRPRDARPAGLGQARVGDGGPSSDSGPACTGPRRARRCRRPAQAAAR